MLKVVNGKNCGSGNGVKRFYIGRSGSYRREFGEDMSGLGNPFVMGKDGSREEVVEKYGRWLMPKLRKGIMSKEKELFFRIVDEVESGSDIELVCWCKPALCHGDVLKRLIEMYLKEVW